MEYKTETRYDGNGQPYQVRIPVLSTETPTPKNTDAVFPARTPVEIAQSRDSAITPSIQNDTTIQNPSISPEDLSLRTALEDKMKFDEANKNKDLLSEEEYRNQALASLQAEIDAQNKVYADKIARAKIEGQNRLGQEGAIQARRGLLGSDFGVSSTNEVTKGNTEVINSLENELNAKLESIRTGARNAGTAKYEAARKAKEEGLNAYIADLQNRGTINAGIADKIASDYLAKGIDPSKNQNYLEQIAKEAGISSGSIVNSYKTKLSAIEKAKIEKDKELADIEYKKQQAIKEGIDAGKYYEVGGRIYDKNNNFVGNKFTPTSEVDQNKIEAQQQQSSMAINNINNLLKDNRYQSISGALQTGSIPFLGDRAAVNEYNQLQGILKLGIRSLIKGQGQISDYEGKILAESASSLSRLTNESEMKDALLKARGVLKTTNGQTTPVDVTNPETGETISGELSGPEIYQLVSEGNSIKYK